MGLINARNLRKAKQLLDKNRHKVGDIVDKAGEKLDKASGGKTSNVTQKATEAAKKYSAGGVSHHGIDGGIDGGIDTPTQGANMHSGAPVDDEATQGRNAGGNADAGTTDATASERVQATHSGDVTGGPDNGADWADDTTQSNQSNQTKP